MGPEDYLQNKLTLCASAQPSNEDSVLLRQKGIEELIYSKLTSKKFRKWSVNEDTKKRVREAITINVQKKQPIQFTFPFGGYKIWRIPSAPEVDWAEFFSFCHYAQYLAQITSFYEPGAILFFSSDDVVVEQMDNFPKRDTDAYAASFRALLNFFKPYFPENLSMKFLQVADMYPDKSEYEYELTEKIIATKETFKTIDPARLAKKIKTSGFNIRWQGAKDLTSLTKEEKEAKINFGPILHDAYCALSKRRAFVRGEDKIVIFPSAPINNGIAIGSTKNSIVKFWTGYGVLQGQETLLSDRILSPEQLNSLKNEKYETINIDIVPLKNFQEIMVFKKALDFTSS
jgi:hypothetical protein